ncbi:hypothetical protein B7463_g7542, partial [Scytalidium lignicola]
MKPVLKRGPKTLKFMQSRPDGQNHQSGADHHKIHNSVPGIPKLPASTFSHIFDAYRSRMYSVWPVVDANSLLERLEESEKHGCLDREAYILATALSAATMTQLNLAPLRHAALDVDSTFMQEECHRIRNTFNYRDCPSIEGILTSFFLHVYHAKADNRNAGMMFLQEAISLARLIQLNVVIPEGVTPDNEDISRQSYDTKILYLLLWVSIWETAQIPFGGSKDFNSYEEGLIELATLFAAFDPSLSHRKLNFDKLETRQLLISIHDNLLGTVHRQYDYDSVQRADFLITKQWMQVLLWQQAMKDGLLSSNSDIESFTFLFPSQVARDLLASIARVSNDELLPLGRDQIRDTACLLVNYKLPIITPCAGCQSFRDHKCAG